MQTETSDDRNEICHALNFFDLHMNDFHNAVRIIDDIQAMQSIQYYYSTVENNPASVLT